MSQSDPLDLIGARGRCLPSLGPSVARILSALDSDSSDSQSVGEMMESDVAIAGRILKVANSAFYNPSGMSFANVGDAIARLGFEEVRRIVSTIGVIDAFQSVECPFDYIAFWRHCLTSAIATGALARRGTKLVSTSSRNANPYFVAGLMHDVGIFVLILCRGKDYHALLERARRESVSLVDLESQTLGVSHAEVGAALLRDWRLPEPVITACEFHHAPSRAPAEVRVWPQVVHLADWISDHEGLGLGVEGDLGRFNEGAWHDLGIEPVDIPSVIADFVTAAEQSDALLSLAG